MEQTNQYCTFYLDKYFLGVAVQNVQEVFRYQPMTVVPLAPQMVRGLINLRGQIITALDLRRRLGMPDHPEEKPPMNVVVRSEGGVVSLLVDSIADVLDVSADSFEPTPETIRGPFRELVCGVYKLSGKLLLILDIEKTINVGDEAGKDL